MTTEFLYDGLDIVKETDGAGDASYLRTLAIDEALVRTDAADMVHFLADALGSTVALTDPAGASATTYTYEPFGRSMVTGAPSPNPFRFTGREHDTDALFFFRARHYHTPLGRFLLEDPLQLAGGINFYVYAENNPITRVDPFGLRWDLANAGRASNTLDKVKRTQRGREIYEKLEKDKNVYKLQETMGPSGYDRYGNTIYLNVDSPAGNPYDGIQTTTGCQRPSAERALAHEMGHALGYPGNDPLLEMINIRRDENPVAKEIGQSERIQYSPCRLNR